MVIDQRVIDACANGDVMGLMKLMAATPIAERIPVTEENAWFTLHKVRANAGTEYFNEQLIHDSEAWLTERGCRPNAEGWW